MSYIYADLPDQERGQMIDAGTLGFCGPACELLENSQTFKIFLEIPGVDTSSIDLELDNNMLLVSGMKPKRSILGGATHISEVYNGSFRRAFAIPKEVDVSKIAASYEDGVLEIEVPKKI